MECFNVEGLRSGANVENAGAPEPLIFVVKEPGKERRLSSEPTASLGETTPMASRRLWRYLAAALVSSLSESLSPSEEEA